MALPADYITGTITLTNGSAAFTGTGTGWLAADFREGDVILGIQDNAGAVYVVQSITGNAAGTLTQPWAGATGTYTYRMRYEWDSSRVSAQTRTLIELLGNGNLMALSGLTGPGVPVFDGLHTMVVKPESDFGDVRGPASAVDERIAVFDGTTGKLLKDGGKTLSEIVPGAGSVTNTILADVPTNTLKGRVAAGAGSPQDLTATQALSILKTAGAYARDNILGTVSLTSGVPTGSIFEVGSNANGIYMKSTSGWMTCVQTVTINLNSNAFQSFTLPATFVGNVGASIAFAVNPLTGASESWWANIGKVGVYSGTTNTLILFRETLVAVTGTAYITTNGRWTA